MKRGFLNGKVAKTPANAQTKTPAVVADYAGTKKIASKLVHIPLPPKHIPEPPMHGSISVDRNFELRLVTLPPGDVPKTMCLLYPGQKEALLAMPDFPAIVPDPMMNLGHLYELADNVPGMGRGVFANVAFRPGDPIMCERPLMLLPVAFVKESDYPPEHYMKIMVDHLSSSSRCAIYDLHNCKSNRPQDIQGIVHTNAIGIGALPGSYEGAYGAVGNDISFLNHSCSPNAVYKWDLKSLVFTVRAIRPIAVGEQIFIAYCYLMQSRANRQKELSSKYGFTCTCTACTLPKIKAKRSDVCRNLLNTSVTAFNEMPGFREHDETIKAWASDPSLPDDHILKRNQDLLRCMEEEQIYPQDVWFCHCAIVCKALCALKDRAGVVELAKKAAGLAMAFKGHDDGWSQVAGSPERTEWWGLRRKSAV